MRHALFVKARDMAMTEGMNSTQGARHASGFCCIFVILEHFCKISRFETQISRFFSCKFSDLKVWGFQRLEGLQV